MKYSKIIIIGLTFLAFSCQNQKGNQIEESSPSEKVNNENEKSTKIPILNFATFHMAGTSDANSFDYDSKDKKSQSETYRIAEMLAAFKPTVICVELEPSENVLMNEDYKKYLSDSSHEPNYSGEIGLIAYPIGKMAHVEKLYCIDEKETAAYNYSIYKELENQVDSITAKAYVASVLKDLNEYNKLSTIDKLKAFNTKEFNDLCINLNADILTHASTKSNFEGADEAAKFYRRNLRIYSNLNQIPLTENDRVFIIMGGTHTAFLNEFIKRSPKYQLENPLSYLK